jgi:hypothetical protein
MRGAPQSGFATLISRMSWRISSGVPGRPPRGLDFQRHQARKPARCHLMVVSGLRTAGIDAPPARLPSFDAPHAARDVGDIAAWRAMGMTHLIEDVTADDVAGGAVVQSKVL